MKYSLSTFVYYKYPLTEAIKRIAQYGYDGVEIWGGRPHAYFEDMDAGRISMTRDVLDSYGMKISNFIPAQFRYPVNIAAHDEQIRKNSVDYLKQNIDTAAKLGAPFVSLCPGFGMYGESLQKAWDCMMKSINEIVEYSKSMLLNILIEPGNRAETDLIVTIDDCIRAISESDGGIGILPDTGHLFINREPLGEVFEKIRGYKCHFHIDDNGGVSDDHLVPGDGSIKFDIFFDRLKQHRYDGYLAVELGFGYCNDPDIAVKRSIDFLKRNCI